MAVAATAMVKQFLPNQHLPLHYIYGPHDCCLCRSEGDVTELTGRGSELESQLRQLKRKLDKAYRERKRG